MREIKHKAILTVHGLHNGTSIDELINWLETTTKTLKESVPLDYSDKRTSFRLMK